MNKKYTVRDKASENVRVYTKAQVIKLLLKHINEVLDSTEKLSITVYNDDTICFVQ